MKQLSIISIIICALLLSCNAEKKKKSMDETPDTTQKTEQPKKVEVRKITPQTTAGKTFFNTVVEAQKDISITAKSTGEIIKVTFDLGKFVRKGDLLAVIENDVQKASLHQAKLALEQAELNLNLKQKSFERERELFEKKVISQEAYELVENSYKTTLLLVDKSKASVETAQVNYNNCFVKSPFSGVIVNRSIQRGQYVSRGSAVARIVDTQNLQAIVGLTHLDLLNYKKHQRKDVEILLSNNTLIHGKIRGVAEAPDKQTSLYSMKIVFESKKDKKIQKRVVFPGMDVTVALFEKEYENSFSISRSSMKFIKNRYYIFVEKEGKARKKEIVILTDIATLRIARFSDNSAEPFNIITTGIDALSDEKAVEIVKKQ